MKTRIIFIALLLLALVSWGSKNAEKPALEKEPVKVCATPGMERLAESWIRGYNKINPDLNFELKQLSLAELKSELTEDYTLGFVRQRPDVNMVAESMWHLILGREIIVAVMNVSNPFTETLKTKGISANDLAGIISSKHPTWNNVLANGSEQPIRVVMQDEPELRLAVTKFLGLDPLVNINVVSSDEDFIRMMQNDVNCIGFCRLATITDAETHEFMSQIHPLPFDRNDNDRIDYNENIFENLDQFERAVWIGKYPRYMVYNIYAISPKRPENEATLNFLSWIVTSGQSAVIQSGFTDLAFYEKQSYFEKLTPPVMLAGDETPENYTTVTVLLIAAAILVFALIATLVWNSRRKSQKLLYDDEEVRKVLRPEAINIPNGLYYDKSHSWAFMEKEGTVKVGIDDFLQHITGNYTGLVMKRPLEMIHRNEVAATLVHEGKKINILAPVSGRIIQANEDLMDYPSLVNNSPYNWGWLYEIQPSNWMREIRFLQMADKYRDFIKKELIRLKDFIIGALQQKELAGVLVLQEGGELPDNVLHDFEPHVWEEFQIRFIENSDIN
jgi:glycine cleavage system H lipoate-binding protein/ABC-type phosphate transport system substrate-binding protein